MTAANVAMDAVERFKRAIQSIKPYVIMRAEHGLRERNYIIIKLQIQQNYLVAI